jgi:hypothetical protein
MDNDSKRLTDFLVSLGLGQVGHTNKTFLGHLLGVYRLMQSEGCTADVCRAGLFHSIYGTEAFQGFNLPLARRPEIRGLIGERAERLAYINCAMDRATLDRAVEADAEPASIRDRLTGEEMQLSRTDLDDLCRVHLFDWLEQVPRSRHGWGYRRAAYRRMAERLGGTALTAYDRVFAQEPAEATSGRYSTVADRP